MRRWKAIIPKGAMTNGSKRATNRLDSRPSDERCPQALRLLEVNFSHEQFPYSIESWQSDWCRIGRRGLAQWKLARFHWHQRWQNNLSCSKHEISLPHVAACAFIMVSAIYFVSRPISNKTWQNSRNKLSSQIHQSSQRSLPVWLSFPSGLSN